MVANKVQIQTKSFKRGSKAVQWESNGDPTFELKEIDSDGLVTGQLKEIKTIV